MAYLLNQNIQFLLNLHIDLVSESTIGYIQNNDYVNFYRAYNLTSDQLKASSIDLIYVSVSTNGGLKKQGINRAELIESLIRIAKARYIDGPKGGKLKLTEALSLLIESCLKPNASFVDQHQTTRLEKIWTIDMNDLLETNLDLLKLLFKELVGKNKDKKGIDIRVCE